jgi:hypothetical protein
MVGWQAGHLLRLGGEGADRPPSTEWPLCRESPTEQMATPPPVSHKFSLLGREGPHQQPLATEARQKPLGGLAGPYAEGEQGWGMVM